MMNRGGNAANDKGRSASMLSQSQYQGGVEKLLGTEGGVDMQSDLLKSVHENAGGKKENNVIEEEKSEDMISVPGDDQEDNKLDDSIVLVDK